MRELRGIACFLLLISVAACKKDPPAPPPFADFLVANNGCTASCPLYFYDQSENAVKWQWKFGHVTTSDKQNDTVTFNMAGIYEVSLKIWNADNVADSVRKNVLVN